MLDSVKHSFKARANQNLISYVCLFLITLLVLSLRIKANGEREICYMKTDKNVCFYLVGFYFLQVVVIQCTILYLSTIDLIPLVGPLNIFIVGVFFLDEFMCYGVIGASKTLRVAIDQN